MKFERNTKRSPYPSRKTTTTTESNYNLDGISTILAKQARFHARFNSDRSRGGQSFEDTENSTLRSRGVGEKYRKRKKERSRDEVFENEFPEKNFHLSQVCISMFTFVFGDFEFAFLS